MTKGLVIGVPILELETGEPGFELNNSRLCAEELGTSKVSSDNQDEF